jgi:xylulokinase
MNKSTKALLGIDVGTSGTKALLVDPDSGTVLAHHTAAYPLSAPQPLWSEQDPADWWRATVDAVRAVRRESTVEVVAIGLTGQMHGLVLLDDAGAVLRPAILWNDQRTGAECDEIHARVGRQRVLALTGNPVLTGFTAPKILWVQRHEPETWARASAILLPKDFLRYRLSGARATDVADASGTSLLDVAGRRWSDEMLAAIDVDRSMLPEVVESATCPSTLSAAVADDLGLPAGLPIAAGGGDQAAQAIGMGIVSGGRTSVTIGTSGVVFAASDAYRYEPDGRLHAFCHANGAWHLMGVMLSAGGSLQWHRDELCDAECREAARRGVDPYDLMLEATADLAPGSEGLVFLPYLTGERTPHPDPLARGAFVGLTLRHTRAHMTRAVVEGITFGLADSLHLVREAGIEVDSVRASGGGARSALWRQILADVLEAEVVTVNAVHGAAFGAALLGGVGAGLWPDVAAACEATITETSRTGPGTHVERYRAVHGIYRELYPALRETFGHLAACSPT